MNADPNAEATSKDGFFAELADISSRMIDAHGKDFCMGALVLAARFVAEGKSSMGEPKNN